jgi:hypothetical protein
MSFLDSTSSGGEAGAVGGAVSGAAAGSMLGPYGAIAGAIIGGLGSLLSAAGSEYSGTAQANMYTYRAGVALMNRQINLQNADYERVAGEVSAQESGMRTKAEVGATVAAQASSGLDVNRGSAVDVRTSETEIGQQNEAIIRSNAARKAYSYDVEATQDQAQSQLDTMAATTSRVSGGIGAATSLLSGGTTVAARWNQGQTLGMFSGNSGATSTSVMGT